VSDGSDIKQVFNCMQRPFHANGNKSLRIIASFSYIHRKFRIEEIK
jgi:hypothetical protein